MRAAQGHSDAYRVRLTGRSGRRHAHDAAQYWRAIWLREVAAPVMAAAMRRAHAKELHLLKETIERPCDR